MGHLFRMVTLYTEAQKRGVAGAFVLLGRHEPAEMRLRQLGIQCVIVDETLPGWEMHVIRQFRPDAWVNDRMDTEQDHVLRVRGAGVPVMTFDDAGSGAPNSDIQVAALADACGVFPEGKRVLTGLEYLILSPELRMFRRLRQDNDRIIVNLGGSDTYGVTVDVIRWLVKNEKSATVVLGPGFQHAAELNALPLSKIEIKSNVPSLVATFSQFDFAITGGGITSFEAAAAGLPTLAIANELHEIDYCLYLQALGCSIYAGYRNEANFNLLKEANNFEKMSLDGINNVPLDGVDNICTILIQMAKLTIGLDK